MDSDARPSHRAKKSKNPVRGRIARVQIADIPVGTLQFSDADVNSLIDDHLKEHSLQTAEAVNEWSQQPKGIFIMFCPPELYSSEDLDAVATSGRPPALKPIRKKGAKLPSKKVLDSLL